MNSIVITLAVLIAVVFLAEHVARWHIRRKDIWRIHQPFSRKRFEVQRDALPNLPPVIEFEANADGERGSPVPEDPSKVFRVTVVGGSAAECYMMDQQDMWSMQLQRKLCGIGVPSHVGNLARSLITCRRLDAVMANVLPHIEALDAIVLMVGASDLVDWLSAKTPAVIEDEDLRIPDYCYQHPCGPFSFAPRRLALYQLFRQAYYSRMRPIEERKNVGRRVATLRAARAAVPTRLDTTPDPSPMLDQFEVQFAKLIDTCLASAKNVVVARQPWLDRPLSDEEEGQIWNFARGRQGAPDVEAYFSTRVVRDLMDRVDQVATRVARAKGVVDVDLRHDVPSDFDHYYDFLHHTPLGNEKVASALVRPLLTIARGSKQSQGGQTTSSRASGPTPT